MGVSTIDTCFRRKPIHVQNLQCPANTKPFRIQVAKIIELTQEQYQHFSTNMLQDMPFIAANRGLMREADGVYHCLLVCTRNSRSGILVESEGFDYARYAAYVADKSALDLRDVVVDHYNLKVREPRSGRER